MFFCKADSTISCGVLFVLFLFTLHEGKSEKIRYATDDSCDRYSLDAVYHEKYKLITNNIFADIKEFVSRVADLIADSLTTVMADLPDRDVSDNEERKVHTQFKHLKEIFSKKVKKIQKNITTSWEELTVGHFNLMFDSGKSSLRDYQNKTIRMTDSYTDARKTLDSLLSSVIGLIKSIIGDGLQGIKMAAEEAVKEDAKKNGTEKEDPSDDSKANKKSKNEILQDKMVEIAKMIVPGFLYKVTAEAIQRKIVFSKKNDIKPENRDSVLDDIEFDMLMLKNRILAIIQLDVPKDKGATDLARRSIYTHWGGLAEEMYQDRIQSKKSPGNSETKRLYYKNLWKDEDQIVETLLNLMEVYP